MRHGDKVNNLGRTAAHRRALLANLAIALIEHKRITTTLAKAKALRRYVEPLVTKAKDNTTHSRRVVFSYLQNKEAVHELFSTVADKIADRPGGYVRVIKLGFRRGDGAETAMIEFVDFNEVYDPNSKKKAGESKKRTRRGGKRSSAVAAAAGTATVAAAVAEPEVEEAVETAVDEVATVAETAVEEVSAVAEEVVEPAVEAEETAPEAETETPSEEEGENKDA